MFWCGEGCVLEACSTTSSSSTSSSSRSSSSRPSSCNRFVFSRIQKGRQAPGQHVFGGSSRISEGTFRPPGNLFLRLIWRSFRPSVAWCFGVAKGAFWRLAAPPLVAAPAAAAGAAAAGPAAAIALFFPESRRDVKPRGSMFLEVLLG